MAKQDAYWTALAYADRTMRELSCVSAEVADGCVLIMVQRHTGLVYRRFMPDRFRIDMPTRPI